MKKLLLNGLLGMFSLLAAETIEVPALYRVPGTAGTGEVRTLGKFSDGRMHLWAAEISDLQKFFGSNGRAGLYLDTDNDLTTGRFPGVSGFDLQFNLNLRQLRAEAIAWPGGTKKMFTFYDDDYVLEIVGDTVFFAVKKEALDRFKFTPDFHMQWVNIGSDNSLRRCYRGLSAKKVQGVLKDKFNFVRFGSCRPGRVRKAEGVFMPRRDGLKVWNSFGERYAENDPVPASSGTVPALRFAAARGESETLVFAVSGDRPFTSFKIRTSGLYRKSGGKIGAGLLQLSYPDFTANDAGEKILDIMLPAHRPARSVNHFAAVTVAVPRDAAPGIYTGAFTPEVNGKAVEPIPVALEVFDFALPAKPVLRTAFSVKSGHISAAFKDPATVNALYEKLWNMARDYRFSPRLMGAEPEVKLDSSGSPVLDFARFDRAAKRYFGEFGFSCYQPTFPQLGSHDNFYRMGSVFKREVRCGDAFFDRVWPRYLKALAAHLREKNLLDKTLLVIWDEPYTVWNEIIHAARLARESAPEFAVGVFIDRYVPEIAPWIQVWLTSFTATVRDLRKRDPGMRVWYYNDLGMANFRIPLSDIRAYAVWAFGHRLEGLLSSEINFLAKAPVGADGASCNLYPAHCWMYASHDGKALYPSLRLTAMRDGLDDADYLSLLKGKLPGEIAKGIPAFAKDGSLVFPFASAREHEAWRLKLARAVERSQRP